MGNRDLRIAGGIELDLGVARLVGGLALDGRAHHILRVLFRGKMRADPAGLFRRGVVGRSRGHCLVLCGGRCIRVCPLRLAVSVLVYGSFSAVSRAGKWRLSRNGHDGLFIFPFHTFDEHKSKDVQLTNTSPMS
jgi:hypothetical protein